MPIYYHCPDTNLPIGGIKVLYNHVAILNQSGLEAYILHGKTGFSCTWFEHKTPIKYFKQLTILPTDYVVISETYFHFFAKNEITLKEKFNFYMLNRKTDLVVAKKLWQAQCVKFLFIQNAYYSLFDFDPNSPIDSLDLQSKVKAIFCISNQNQAYLQFAFPKIEINRLHWSLNTGLFQLGTNKEKLITYMPRKNDQHSKQVMAILKSRANLFGFRIEAIDRMNEQEVANKLKQSTFFLSFGYPEGLPLPPAEAMACGCVVIGYDGGGGAEYFDGRYSYTIPLGDIIAFAKKVEELCEAYQIYPEMAKQQGELASETILSRYSLENERELLLETWKRVLT